MNGNVFKCFHEQPDQRQFAKTVKALDEYGKKNLRYSEDLSSLFGDMIVLPAIPEPDDPIASVTQTQTLIWNEEVKEYVKQACALKGNLATIYAISWGQSSEAMKAKLKSLDDYEMRRDANDCAWLLTQIRAVTLQFDSTKNIFLLLLDARAHFLMCRQTQEQTPESYLSTLRGWAEVIKLYGGSVAKSFELVPNTDEDGNPRDVATRSTMARDRTLVMALIRGANPYWYGTLVMDLSNQHAMGIDNYPTDLTAAYALLENYKTPTNRSARRNTPATTTPCDEGIMFAQASSVLGTNGQTHDDVECYNCHQLGHYTCNCPRAEDNITLLQYGCSLMQASHYSGLPKSWILLDTESMVSVFNNPDMISDIRPSNSTLRVQTNGGYQDSNMEGTFCNLGRVWFNRALIANILSLAAVRKVCRVTMDMAIEPALHVHHKDGTVMKFIEQAGGLYVFDSASANAGNYSESISAYSFLSAIADNKKLFTKREVDAADTARALYQKIGRPSEAEFLNILSKNHILNCPITVDDAKRASIIYGPDIATLKGKMTCSSAAQHVPTFVALPIPAHIAAHHRDLTLCMDFFFVQGIPFLHSISQKIGF
jgi:hypothetical protein